MKLIELRSKYDITQQEAASFLNIPSRTYRRYEQDDNYGDQLKRQQMIDSLIEQFEITESKGLLTISKIKDALVNLFETNYKNHIDFCYLFGSYAKGKANEKSDVDLYVVSDLQGFNFVGLMEDIHVALHKNVDVIRSEELENNIELTNEIMKWGIRIYG